MQLGLVLLAAISLIELLIWLKPFWLIKKPLAYLVILGLSLVSIYLTIVKPSGWIILLDFLSLYRSINLARLIKGRTLADYLYRVSRKSSWHLIIFQLVTLGLMTFSRHFELSGKWWLQVLVGLNLIVVLALVLSTIRNIRKTKPQHLELNFTDRDLPSLTVALPARNETDDLEACLSSLISSNYPKLEILVLDDCSQNKRTPEIIRSYAHDGVRFIAGNDPPEGWLAKTYAYEQLAKEASGNLILFCGVDTRFTRESLRLIVGLLLKNKKSMLSVMPDNVLPEKRRLAALLIQPSRYAWELALPRRLLNRPPVLSTCWLITAELLKRGGSFKSVARNASPESYFAKLSLKNDGYSFRRSNGYLGLSSIKAADEQRDTAIRTRYPQVHRRLELVSLLSLTEIFVFVLPAFSLTYSLVASSWLIFGLSLASVFVLNAFYLIFVKLTYNRLHFWFVARFVQAATLDIYLLNYSMWLYEFREVIWKGRNVCLPVMRAYKGLS